MPMAPITMPAMPGTAIELGGLDGSAYIGERSERPAFDGDGTLHATTVKDAALKGQVLYVTEQWSHHVPPAYRV